MWTAFEIHSAVLTGVSCQGGRFAEADATGPRSPVEGRITRKSSPKEKRPRVPHEEGTFQVWYIYICLFQSSHETNLGNMS